MHPAHITLSILLLLSALGVLLGANLNQPDLFGYSIVAGWFLTLLAVVGTAAVVIYLAVQSYRGEGKAAIRASWLGLANGIAAVIVAAALGWK